MERVVTSPEYLGHLLREHRKAKKLNQTQAGEPFYLNQSTVSTIEQGFSGTRIDTIFRLLAALNLELAVRAKPSKMPTFGEDW